MGWGLGGPDQRGRDVGYMVPAYCDHPDCSEQIDRGLAHVCCDEEPYGGDDGCGLYFCSAHQNWRGQCERCAAWFDEDEDGEDVTLEDGPPPFDPKPECPRWLYHKLYDYSWAEWRVENVDELDAMRVALGDYRPPADDEDTKFVDPEVAVGTQGERP